MWSSTCFGARSSRRAARPTALSHKLFRLDIVYGLFGVPERGSHVGPRGKGRPSKKRPASGAGASSSTPGVLDSPDRAAKRKEAGGYRWKGGGGGASTVKKSKTTTGAGKSRRVHEYPEVTLAAGAGLPNERFDQINDLHTHAAWDSPGCGLEMPRPRRPLPFFSLGSRPAVRASSWRHGNGWPFYSLSPKFWVCARP